MKWNERFTQDSQPDLGQISAQIGSPLWKELRGYLEQTYSVQPRIEYSKCSGAPGWNVKYKKSGRALCTLYPHAGFFTCLVSVAGREAMKAELLLYTCTEYVRELYWGTRAFNGSRWLMIDVTSAEILEDAEKLIALRVRPPKKGLSQIG